jgi:hypothetical protein
MKPRDIELLSAYLDGQIKPSDSARLEARLKTEPELASVMDDLRTARGYLRQLPQRRAPRNFTLTRKMVGLNPPLPRAYPAFRFATTLATLLFFLTFGFNFLAPQIVSQQAYGIYGMGGGGSAEVEIYSAEAPALEAPLPESTAAPAEPAAAAPASTLTVEGTPGDTERIVDTPVAKEGEDAGNALAQSQPQEPPQEPQAAPPLVPSIWQFILLGVAIVSAVFMVVIRRVSVNRWK